MRWRLRSVVQGRFDDRERAADIVAVGLERETVAAQPEPLSLLRPQHIRARSRGVIARPVASHVLLLSRNLWLLERPEYLSQFPPTPELAGIALGAVRGRGDAVGTGPRC